MRTSRACVPASPTSNRRLHRRRSKPPALEQAVASVRFGLATLAEHTSHCHRRSLSQEPLESSTIVQPVAMRDAIDFFRSVLPAHIARPMPYRSSRFSRPAFFCRSFFRALLQANSCVRQLRDFCFPGSALTSLGSLP